MSSIVRLGDPSAGHCFPPRGNDEASPNVFVNGIPVHRQGDHWPVHCCGSECHDGFLSAGSSSVFVNGSSIARTGDPISCGDVALVASPNVFAGG